MLTGKQRSFLKSIANTLKPIAQIGKEGVSESFLAQLDAELEKREIIKVNVLDNSSEDTTLAAVAVAKALDADFVQAIGNKFTIYRQSRENPELVIPGAIEGNERVRKNLQKKNQVAKDNTRITKKGGKMSKPLKNKTAKFKRAQKEK